MNLKIAICDDDASQRAVLISTPEEDIEVSLSVQKESTVKAEAKIPVSLSVCELDLSIIIGNLLDNAIDACLTSDCTFLSANMVSS